MLSKPESDSRPVFERAAASGPGAVSDAKRIRAAATDRVAAQALRQLPTVSVTSLLPPVRRGRLPVVLEAAPDDDSPTAPLVPIHPNATFDEHFEIWRAAVLSQRKDGGESVRRSVLKDVHPSLGHRPMRAIRRDDVVLVLESIVNRGAARQAGCVLADLRQMFRWAVDQGHLAADPTVGLKKSDFGGAAQARRRRLTSEEISELAHKMQGVRLARHIRHAIWLMLATGARIGEIALARWQDIDPVARTWTLPAEASHSGRPHVIALSDFALRHFFPKTPAQRSDVWVFGGRSPSEPLSPKALGKQIRDRQRGTQIRGRASATTSLLLNGGAWTPLDLRRTTAALLAEQGTRADVIAHCLNQGRGRHPSEASTSPAISEACRAALDRLGERLDAIERMAAGGGVTQE